MVSATMRALSCCVQPRHQARDLDGQLDAHIFIIVIGEIAVDRRGRGDIGGDRGAGGGRAMLGQILQHRIAGIGALAPVRPGFRARALPECPAHARGSEALRAAQIPIGRGLFPCMLIPGRDCRSSRTLRAR